MDIEALLDPRGGDGYADGINAGLMGILGIGMDRSLVSWAYSKRYLHSERRMITKARANFVREGIKAAPYIGGATYTDDFEAVKNKGEKFGNTTQNGKSTHLGRRPQHTTRPVTRQAPHFMNEWKGSPQNAKLKQEFKATKAGLKSFNRTVRMVGWGFILDGLFQIGEAVATPGISATSVKKDMMALADESPFDSARSATGRQRALQAIHDSQMTVRNVISNEASFLHK